MSFHGFLLLGEISEIGSHVVVGVGLAFDIFSASEEMVFLFFDMDVISSDVTTKVDVSCFGILDVLSKIVAVLRDSIDILSKGDALNILLSVKVLDSSNFSLGIIKSN